MKILLCTGLFACFLTSVMGQSIIYVDSSNTGLANGNSWATAYPDLQDALETAQPGNHIWVAKGTYTPSKDKNDIVPSFGSHKVFMMRKGVKIYGGFNGSETSINQRNWTAYKSILDGDQKNTVSDSYSVIGADSIDSTAALDGFYITRGKGGTYVLGIGYQLGGGICLTYSNLSLSNLVIHNNRATRGGGIGMLQSHPYMVNLKITDNSVTNLPGAGGGVFLDSSDAIFVNCLIAKNYSGGGWGSGLAVELSSPVLINVSIVGNTASGSSIPYSIINIGFPNHYGNPIIKNSIIDGFTSSVPSAIFFYNSVIGGHRFPPQWDTLVGVDGGGNLSAYMHYTDAVNGNFRTEYCSDNIDAGSNQYLPIDILDMDHDGDTTEMIPIDIEGNARVYNGIVDMGAYERTSLISADTVETDLCLGQSVMINDTLITTHGFHLMSYPRVDSCDRLVYYNVKSPVNTGITLDTIANTLRADLDSAKYQWYDCNNKFELPGDTNQTLSPWTQGSYSVIITHNGCTDTSGCITINKVGLLASPAKLKLNIYPNPSKGLYHLKFTEPVDGGKLVIYNFSGEAIYKEDLNKLSEAPIDISGKASGVYILKIYLNGTVGVYRLIKN